MTKSDRRYFVPDLTPAARPALARVRPSVVFVAESPHLSEITPESEPERRPLCGKAGLSWWATLGELLEGEATRDLTLASLERVCLAHRLAVLNAVQFPLDPKIMPKFPDADPLRTAGFSKAPGPHHYKKSKGTPALDAALESLGARLRDPALAACPIHPLGLDALWFVERALTSEERAARLGDRVHHPSAWWRRGGVVGREAREALKRILKPG